MFMCLDSGAHFCTEQVVVVEVQSLGRLSTTKGSGKVVGLVC